MLHVLNKSDCSASNNNIKSWVLWILSRRVIVDSIIDNVWIIGAKHNKKSIQSWLFMLSLRDNNFEPHLLIQLNNAILCVTVKVNRDIYFIFYEHRVDVSFLLWLFASILDITSKIISDAKTSLNFNRKALSNITLPKSANPQVCNDMNTQFDYDNVRINTAFFTANS